MAKKKKNKIKGETKTRKVTKSKNFDLIEFLKKLGGTAVYIVSENYIATMLSKEQATQNLIKVGLDFAGGLLIPTKAKKYIATDFLLFKSGMNILKVGLSKIEATKKFANQISNENSLTINEDSIDINADDLTDLKDISINDELALPEKSQTQTRQRSLIQNEEIDY